MHATCPTHIILLDLIPVMKFDDSATLKRLILQATRLV
jgi:hypothetical protein